IGKPEVGVVVAASLHEGEVLAAGHRSRGQLKGCDHFAVARQFVVKAEAAVVVAADFRDPFCKRQPAQRRSRVRTGGRTLDPGRMQGVVGKSVFQVSDDQFLMLLLMIEPEPDKGGELVPPVLRAALDQLTDGLVY